jgi:hypothetical protein
MLNSLLYRHQRHKVINEYIDRNKGNVEPLEITDDSNGLLYAQLVTDKVDNPRFSDKISGLGITIHDVWAYEVFITDYKTNGNNFSMKLKYIYWDHFGLDFPDIINYDNDIFYSWFILQHFRGFKPFITKIAIIGELNGKY